MDCFDRYFSSLQQRATIDSVKIRQRQDKISKRLLDTFQHGLIEVDINSLFDGFTDPERFLITQGTKAIMLSDFCRGGCRECGLNAKPYSKKNREILALNPLIEFLEKGNFMGDLMFYDASDPLDYPYLLELLKKIEQMQNIHKVLIATSCPPGSEQVFEELLKSDFSKVLFQPNGFKTP